MNNLTYKVVENSKNTSGESGNNPAGGSGQLTEAQITELVQLAADGGCTHFANHFFMDTDAQMQANYSGYATNYNLRTLDADIQLWADIIHAAGMKCIYRGSWSGIKGNNDFGFVKYGTGSFVPLGTAGTNFTDAFTVDDLSANYTSTGAWTVAGGELISPTPSGWNNICVTQTSYTNFTVTARLKSLIYNTQLIFRESGGAGYGIQIRAFDGVLRLERYGLANLVQVSKSFTIGNWYRIRVTCSGTSIKCRVWADNVSEPSTWDIDTTDATYSSGKIGFSSESEGAHYDDLEISTLVAGESTYAGKMLRFMQTTIGPDHLADGDIFMPVSECTEYLSNANYTWFDTSAGTQTGLYNFFTTLHDVVDNYASSLGISLGFATIVNYSEYASGYLNSTLAADTNHIAIDYYGHVNYSGGQRANPTAYIEDWTAVRTTVGAYPLWQTEMGGIFGDSWPSLGVNAAVQSPKITTYEDSAHYQIQFWKAYRDSLVDPGLMNGVSNWGMWSGQNSSIVYYSSGHYGLNYCGQIYANFIKGNGMARIPVPTDTTTVLDAFGSRSYHF